MSIGKSLPQKSGKPPVTVAQKQKALTVAWAMFRKISVLLDLSQSVGRK